MILRDEIDSASLEYIGAPIREGSGINIMVDPVEVALTATRSSVGAAWTSGTPRPRPVRDRQRVRRGDAWTVLGEGPGDRQPGEADPHVTEPGHVLLTGLMDNGMDETDH